MAGRSSDAAAAPPAAASAASIASVRRIVGSRRELPTVSAADRNDDADGAVDFVSSSDVLLAVDDDDWTYPDPSTYLPTLHTHYQFHLEPTSHPVFGKYKQTDLDSIVGEVMKFVMLRENTGMMVTHKEILTLLQDRCKSGATYIIADARRRFMELYGYELHEVHKEKPNIGASECVCVLLLLLIRPTFRPLAHFFFSPSVSTALCSHPKQVSKSDAPSGDSKKRKSVATSNSATKAYILRTPNFPSVGLRRAWNTDLALKADNESVARRGLLFWLYAFIHAEESSQTRGATIADGVTGVEEKKLWSQMKSTLKLDRDMVRHHITHKHRESYMLGSGIDLNSLYLVLMIPVCVLPLFCLCDVFSDLQKYHSVFGNVSNLIDEFVKQQSDYNIQARCMARMSDISVYNTVIVSHIAFSFLLCFPSLSGIS